MAEEEKSIGQSIKDTVSKGLSDFKSFQEEAKGDKSTMSLPAAQRVALYMPLPL